MSVKMPVRTKWPLYRNDSMIVGDKNSDLAICTLWTDTGRFKKINNKKFSFLFNLFSSASISFLLRNIFSNPIINKIVLCGSDIAGSGEDLLKLKENGINKDHTVIGAEYRIDGNIPKRYVDLFRKNVEIIDLRGITDPATISKKIEELETSEAKTDDTVDKPSSKPADSLKSSTSSRSSISSTSSKSSVSTEKKSPKQFCKPKIFKQKKANVSSLPSQQAGFVIREDKIGDVWIKLLHRTLNFGTIKASHHSNLQKELLNVMVVVEDEDPDQPEMHKSFRFNKKDLIKYYPLMTDKKKPTGVRYTYGERICSLNEVQQLEKVIDSLKKDEFTRRAVCMVWDVQKDFGKKYPPCMIFAQFMIQNSQLFMTCYFRSNDIFKAFPMNAFGALKLHKEVAGKLDMKRGSMTYLIGSAHIYEEDLVSSKRIVKNNLALTWKMDRCGYFTIDADGKKIIIRHYSPEHVLVGEYAGKKAEELSKTIIREGLTSIPNHLIYLGRELQKAETANRKGLKYIQDSPLDFTTRQGVR